MPYSGELACYYLSWESLFIYFGVKIADRGYRCVEKVTGLLTYIKNVINTSKKLSVLHSYLSVVLFFAIFMTASLG